MSINIPACTDTILHGFDCVERAIEPFCKHHITSIIPRIVQVALITLGLSVTVPILILSSVAAIVPLCIQHQINFLRRESLYITIKLLDKLAKAIIGTIPFAGLHILSKMDEEQEKIDMLEEKIKMLEKTESTKNSPSPKQKEKDDEDKNSEASTSSTET
jgi:hypothetical protein